MVPVCKHFLATRSTFNKKRLELKNTTKEGDNGYLTKFWRNTGLGLSAPVEKGHLINKENSTQKKRLPFVMQNHAALPNLKNILVGKWHLIQNYTGKKIIKINPGQI